MRRNKARWFYVHRDTEEKHRKQVGEMHLYETIKAQLGYLKYDGADLLTISLKCYYICNVHRLNNKITENLDLKTCQGYTISVRKDNYIKSGSGYKQQKKRAYYCGICVGKCIL